MTFQKLSAFLLDEVRGLRALRVDFDRYLHRQRETSRTTENLSSVEVDGAIDAVLRLAPWRQSQRTTCIVAPAALETTFFQTVHCLNSLGALTSVERWHEGGWEVTVDKPSFRSYCGGCRRCTRALGFPAPREV